MVKMRYTKFVLILILLIMATVTKADDILSLQQIYDINLPVLEIETVNGEIECHESACKIETGERLRTALR